MIVHCSQLKVEEDKDADACELVNGSELRIGEGDDTIHAYLFKAVKNNNGAGILLLSDIFGFEDSYTRDFAYRVACGGYKYVCFLSVGFPVNSYLKHSVELTHTASLILLQFSIGKKSILI